MAWPRWCPTSTEQLIQYEQKVLSLCKKPYEIDDIDVGLVGDCGECKIHTIKVWSDCADEEKGTPLVLLHGFGCGAAIYAANFDELSKKRDVYAIDMPGFGLSSRPQLGDDAKIAEELMVKALEEWRSKLQLEKFILLGHSLGGFVSSAYALSHSQHVKHLILEDPWGFDAYDPANTHVAGIAMSNALKFVNVFAALRAAGPAGPSMMRLISSMSHRRFIDYYPMEPDTIPLYLYHCNTQKPTGEEFFRAISVRFGWTQFPMVTRLGKLDKDTGITFIFAGNTFIPRTPGFLIKEERKESVVDILDVPASGHEIHSEFPQEFNKLVNEACDKVDGGGSDIPAEQPAEPVEPAEAAEPSTSD